MSLINCPECGNAVSSKAPTCPACGVQIAGNVKRCPICNTFLLMDAEECPKCHTHFIIEEQELPTTETEETTDGQDGEPIATDQTATQKVETGKISHQEDPPKKKGGSKMWLPLLIILILLGIGGFVIWSMTSTRETEEEKAYSLLENCKDLRSYESFIAYYPKSRHIDDVRERWNALKVEESAWDEVKRSLNVTDIETFVTTYPTSTHRQAALHRIDSLDWREAEKGGSTVTYTLYINKHENGEYITEAYAAREEALRRESQAATDSAAIKEENKTN